jgi:ABC-type lipoprotein export system ATPase subunit
MVISYKGNSFDTNQDIEIRYHGDEKVKEFADHIISVVRKEGVVPSTIGFVSKYFPFLSNLSIIENIILPLEYHSHMEAGDAVEKVRHYIESLGIERIASNRKENISNIDLYKAMFVRALAMDPSVVFFSDFRYAVTLKEFRSMLMSCRELLLKRTNLWIGVSEGHSIEWEHDMEVTLDT